MFEGKKKLFTKNVLSQSLLDWNKLISHFVFELKESQESVENCFGDNTHS